VSGERNNVVTCVGLIVEDLTEVRASLASPDSDTSKHCVLAL